MEAAAANLAAAAASHAAAMARSGGGGSAANAFPSMMGNPAETLKHLASLSGVNPSQIQELMENAMSNGGFPNLGNFPLPSGGGGPGSSPDDSPARMEEQRRLPPDGNSPREDLGEGPSSQVPVSHDGSYQDGLPQLYDGGQTEDEEMPQSAPPGVHMSSEDEHEPRQPPPLPLVPPVQPINMHHMAPPPMSSPDAHLPHMAAAAAVHGHPAW